MTSGAVRRAAMICKKLTDDMTNRSNFAECNSPHVEYMCMEILKKNIKGRKAHRWLGWIQCAIVMGSKHTLEEMKQINKNAKEILGRRCNECGEETKDYFKVYDDKVIICRECVNKRNQEVIL